MPGKGVIVTRQRLPVCQVSRHHHSSSPPTASRSHRATYLSTLQPGVLGVIVQVAVLPQTDEEPAVHRHTTSVSHRTEALLHATISVWPLSNTYFLYSAILHDKFTHCALHIHTTSDDDDVHSYSVAVIPCYYYCSMLGVRLG